MCKNVFIRKPNRSVSLKKIQAFLPPEAGTNTRFVTAACLYVVCRTWPFPGFKRLAMALSQCLKGFRWKILTIFFQVTWTDHPNGRVFTWFTWICLYQMIFYFSTMVNHHEKPPFGEFVWNFFLTTEQVNPRCWSQFRWKILTNFQVALFFDHPNGGHLKTTEKVTNKTLPKRRKNLGNNFCW